MSDFLKMYHTPMSRHLEQVEKTVLLAVQGIRRLAEEPLMSQRRDHFLNNTTPVRMLGKGAEGEVCRAMDKHDGFVFAVKKIQLDPTLNGRPVIPSEVRILSLLATVGEGEGRETVCLPAMKDFWYPATPDVNNQVLLVQDCSLGSLANWIERKSMRSVDNNAEPVWVPVHEGLLRHLYTQMLAGIAFLHTGFGTTAFDPKGKGQPIGRRPIVHKDIKPQNILVCPAPADAAHPSLVTLKISDFGAATEFSPSKPPDSKMPNLWTHGYVAPEFLEPSADWSTATPANDVYAVGAIIYCSVFGECPSIEQDEYSGEILPFRPRTIKRIKHQGGARYSADLSSRVANAVTDAARRHDALTILENLRPRSAWHSQLYVRWMADVEEPRAERQRRADLAAKGFAPLADEERQRLAPAARLQCHGTDCGPEDYRPHTHACGSPAEQCAGQQPWERHVHDLKLLEGTVLDPREHLPKQLHQDCSHLIRKALRNIRNEAEEHIEDAL